MASVHKSWFVSAVLSLVFVHCLGQESFCRNGWTYHDGSCYAFGQAAVSWPEAQQFCYVYEGSLAEIETKDENDFLKNMAKNQSVTLKAAWLGGTDIFMEGSWEWAKSKEPIGEFTDWFPGEPNQSGVNPGGEDCLQFLGPENWQWNDENCETLAYFICEKRLDGLVIG